MSASQVLALDAMGGDRAPGIVVAGANLAMKRFPDARFRLVGKPDRIGKILRRFPKLANVSEIVPADVVIGVGHETIAGAAAGCGVPA